MINIIKSKKLNGYGRRKCRGRRGQGVGLGRGQTIKPQGREDKKAEFGARIRSELLKANIYEPLGKVLAAVVFVYAVGTGKLGNDEDWLHSNHE